MITKAKKLWLWIGIPVGLVLVILLAAVLPIRGTISGFASVDSREVVSNVYAVRGASYVNFYIVKGDNGLAAFDGGENLNTAAKEMVKLNLDTLKVNAVFLTHTDSDHADALGLFSNARAYTSEQEEQLINGKTARALVFPNNIPAGYSLLRDGQDMETAGMKVHCILTPGHTPGAM